MLNNEDGQTPVRKYNISIVLYDIPAENIDQVKQEIWGVRYEIEKLKVKSYLNISEVE